MATHTRYETATGGKKDALSKTKTNLHTHKNKRNPAEINSIRFKKTLLTLKQIPEI